MKNIKSLVIIATLLSSVTLSYAASLAASPAVANVISVSTLPMVNAEVRKIDMENKKITLKHGEIKNLDMPGMTMVFTVKDASMLDKLAVGEKIMFSADKIDNTFTVLSIVKIK